MNRAGIPFFGRASCEICGAGLTMHQDARGTICGDPGCRRKYALGLAQAEREREKALQKRVEAHRDRVLASMGMEDPSGYVVGILRSNDVPLAQTAWDRRREFREHLVRVVEEAWALDPSETPDPEEPDREVEEVAALLLEACKLCRGYCCLRGRSCGGYVRAPTILRHIDRHPDRAPEEVVEDYLSRVRERTYRDSCIYHGEGGCSLPRRMRARVCGWYRCRGLEELERTLLETGADRAFLVAVTDGREMRTSVAGPPLSGGRPEPRESMRNTGSTGSPSEADSGAPSGP